MYFKGGIIYLGSTVSESSVHSYLALCCKANHYGSGGGGGAVKERTGGSNPCHNKVKVVPKVQHPVPHSVWVLLYASAYPPSLSSHCRGSAYIVASFGVSVMLPLKFHLPLLHLPKGLRHRHNWSMEHLALPTRLLGRTNPTVCH